MAKYLLLLAIVVLAGFWLARRYGNRSASSKTTAASPQEEDMVRCEQCGVHLPRSESLLTRGYYYCSPEHQRQHTPPS